MPRRTAPPSADDELGAHVSTAGGVATAPGRARAIGAANLQLFTKQPSRWAEPEIDAATAAAFAAARREHRIRVAGAHDSYLINLSSPDRALWERSAACFAGELRRATALGLDFVVTHPGNATDGDLESGLARNADGLVRALEEVPAPPAGGPAILLELTAGSGSSVGASFENLAAILERVPRACAARLGVCVDSCHAYAAGYDLVRDYDGVWRAFDDLLGLERLRLFHLNDSKTPFASRRDRHEHIGEGSLGLAPFRRLLLDERFHAVPKLLETPKHGDPLTYDVRNLERLRGLRTAGGRRRVTRA